MQFTQSQCVYRVYTDIGNGDVVKKAMEWYKLQFFFIFLFCNIFFSSSIFVRTKCGDLVENEEITSYLFDRSSRVLSFASRRLKLN